MAGISEKRQPQALNQALHTLIDLRPARPSMNLVLWTEKKTYAVGDEVAVLFRANSDGYLTVLNIGSSGQVRVVFPSKGDALKRFKRGEIHRVPSINSRYGIQVTGPPGRERIKAIVTEQPWRLPESNSGAISPVANSRSYGPESIRQAVEKLQKQSWGEAQTEITVIEGDTPDPAQGRERQVKPKPPEKPIDITGTPGRGDPKVQLSEKEQNMPDASMPHSK